MPGCRALDVLGELDPCSRAHVDYRPVRVPGIPDGDQCLAGPDFDAVAVGSAVGGLPPVYLSHVTYCDRLITFREQPTARSAQSVTNSLQTAHAGHDAQCAPDSVSGNARRLSPGAWRRGRHRAAACGRGCGHRWRGCPWISANVSAPMMRDILASLDVRHSLGLLAGLG